MTIRDSKTGIFYMILASLGFSIMGALAKYSMARIPPIETIFFRAATCLPFLFWWMKSRKIPFIPKNNKVQIMRSAFGFTALVLNFYSVREMGLAEVTALIHTSPLFVALLSMIFLKEKVGLKLAALIACAFAGTLFIIKPHPGHFNIWAIICLLSALFAAIAYVSLKYLHKSDSSYTIVFNFLSFSALFSFVFIPTFLWPTPLEWMALLATGVVGTIAQLLMTKAYQLADATIVSPYFFAAVFFASIWGMLFWGEMPDWLSIAGTLLIVLCGIGILRLDRTTSTLVKTPPE